MDGLVSDTYRYQLVLLYYKCIIKFVFTLYLPSYSYVCIPFLYLGNLTVQNFTLSMFLLLL